MKSLSVLHPRLIFGFLAGVIAWAAASQLHAPAGARFLIGWNAGAGVYLALMWIMFVTADADAVCQRAARQDEDRGVIFTLAIIAVAASLVGIVTALTSIRGETASTHNLVTALAATTLASSWFVVQSLFAGHYAHRHFAEVAAHGEDAGFLFPGDPPRVYLDFVYFAVTIGASTVVSDVAIRSTRLRNLVTVHTVTSFFYNAAVVALGIGILSGLIPH